MVLYALENNKKPDIDPSAYVHPDAVLIGEVRIGKNSFIAPGAVLRADLNQLTIGDNCSIQDNVVIHTTKEFVTQIGSRVNIGHGSLIHAKTIYDNVMIGMGVKIGAGVTIGTGSVLGDGTVIVQYNHVPDNVVMVGVPGKVYRRIDDENDPVRKTLNEFLTHYKELANRYKKHLKKIE